MAKVNVISGFLGAGKTTFIKELLEKVFKGQKVVLIENEFGEIGIDGGFLKNAGVEITEMNSGCICCSLVGDFAEALSKVETQFHPDRILIEPSGVGKLSDVEKAIRDIPDSAGIELDSGIAIVDAKKAKKYLKNFGEFFNNQIKYADTVVLSRTGDIDETALAECLEIVRSLNDKAAIITTPWDKISGEVLAKALSDKNAPMDLFEDDDECDDPECECHHHHHHHEEGEECCHHDHHHHEHDDDDHEHEEHEHGCCHHEHDGHEHHHHHHHHDADEVFTSWGAETVHKYSRSELEALLKTLAETETYGTILRSKGIVALDDGSWAEFDLVPEETELRSCSANYTGRICVIGTALKEEELEKAFCVKA